MLDRNPNNALELILACILTIREVSIGFDAFWHPISLPKYILKQDKIFPRHTKLLKVENALIIFAYEIVGKGQSTLINFCALFRSVIV